MGGSVLKAILYFAWLTGCFPAQVPLKRSRYFKFTFCHPITFFSLAVMIFDIAVMVDFSVHSMVNYTQTTLGTGLSALIVETGRVVYIMAGDASVRIISILCCPLVIELIQLIEKLESLRQNPCRFCHYMYKAYVTIALANIFLLTHHYIRVSNFVDLFQPIPAYVQLIMVPDIDWIIRLVFWLQYLFIVSALSYASSICILLGTNLISLYLGFCNELKVCWSQCKSTRIDWIEEEFLEKFIDKFKELKRGFDVFTVVAGPLALAVMFHLVLSLIHSVFSLSTTQAVKNIPGTFGCIFWLFFVSFFGNFMQTKIRQKREELRNSMMLIPRDIPNIKMNVEKLKEVTNWVIGWKWSLSAGNLFTVNNTLVPSALGTTMTYVIFVFQLQMTERQNGPSANSTVY